MKNYAVIMKTSWGPISEVDNYNPDTSLEFCEEKSLLMSLKSNSRIISDSMHLTVRFASLRCFIDAAIGVQFILERSLTTPLG